MDPRRRDSLLLFLGAGMVAVLATASALLVRPLPFSDWAYYWSAAEGSFPYERGGVMVFVLRAMQTLQLAPYATALIMNLAAAAALLVTAWKAEAERVGIATLLVIAYLLVIGPYFAVVQFDLAATAFLCAGLACLASEATGARKRRDIIVALVLLACAVSSRPQFFLILPVLGMLFVLTTAVAGGRGRLLRSRGLTSAAVLLAAALLGFAADSTLRSTSGRAEAVRTSSGVTLYAGLLSSGTSRPTCGHWSERATRDARADAHLPLLPTVLSRLQEHPPGHWLAVLRCKAPEILMPGAYALAWSLGSPNVVERPQDTGSPTRDIRIRQLHHAEHRAYFALLLLIYGFVMITTARHLKQRAWMPAALPLLWIASYWAVHAVFEIQGRYFLSLFLLLPFMVMPRFRRLVE